ncbi:hypothetical protein [Pollutibacter soli]|uniref:hypothetical protein n=1 Tax=Pollutibacter soli TaxID=3034157 RepID=UPI0030135AF5
MKRLLFFGYGCLAYGIFCFSLMYSFLFIGNFINNDTELIGTGTNDANALFINLILLGFISMFYQFFLRTEAWNNFKNSIPQPLRRSTFVLLCSLCAILFNVCWIPMDQKLWMIKQGLLHDVLIILFIGGWMLALLSTFLINHFDFFGVRQTWLYFQRRNYFAPKFKTALIQKIAYHPMYLGLMIGFWVTPVMTVSHFLTSLLVSFLVLAVASNNEFNLFSQVGNRYKNYINNIPVSMMNSRRKRAA